MTTQTLQSTLWEAANTLRSPAFTDGAGGIAKFDCVIANPPLSEAIGEFKKAMSDTRAAEDHLRTVLADGGWLE